MSTETPETPYDRRGPKMAEIPAGRRDEDVAREHRDKIVGLIQPLLEAMNAARRDGFEPEFQFGIDAAKRSFLAQFRIIKVIL